MLFLAEGQEAHCWISWVNWGDWMGNQPTLVAANISFYNPNGLQYSSALEIEQTYFRKKVESLNLGNDMRVTYSCGVRNLGKDVWFNLQLNN
jgi:hypothetical protein